MTRRSEGERIRAYVVLERLRACLNGVEIALRDDGTPIGLEAGQAVTQTAIELAVLMAKTDAYQRAEADQRHLIPIPTEDDRQVLGHPFKAGEP